MQFLIDLRVAYGILLFAGWVIAVVEEGRGGALAAADGYVCWSLLAAVGSLA